MFLLRQPDGATLAALLEQQSHEPFSYSPAGLSARDIEGYCTGYTELLLGHGVQVYTAGCEAIAAGAQFDITWARLQPSPLAEQPSLTCSMMRRHMGFWSMNA